MEIPYYQVNAFTETFNAGNPAGVCPLTEWLADDTMQAIAREVNLSETAFFVPNETGYQLRWFAPGCEVDLCGHATLASAHVVFTELDTGLESVSFATRSGTLQVSRDGNGYVMQLPLAQLRPGNAPEKLLKGLAVVPMDSYKGMDYLLVFEKEEIIRTMQPDFSLVQDIELRGTIVTAPSDQPGVDYVSRFFGSAMVGIEEDPATGSAQSTLAPYWGKRLGKTSLVARQLSKRGARFNCELINDRVNVSGSAVTFIKGHICLDGK
jgi:PhzF family phenazine biosynthesis protein